MTKGELKGIVREIVEESLRDIMLDGGYLLEIIKYVNRNSMNNTKIVERVVQSPQRSKKSILGNDEDPYDSYQLNAPRKTQADRVVQEHLERHKQTAKQTDPYLPAGEVPLETIAGFLNNKYHGDTDNSSYDEDEEW